MACLAILFAFFATNQTLSRNTLISFTELFKITIIPALLVMLLLSKTNLKGFVNEWFLGSLTLCLLMFLMSYAFLEINGLYSKKEIKNTGYKIVNTWTQPRKGLDMGYININHRDQLLTLKLGAVEEQEVVKYDSIILTTKPGLFGYECIIEKKFIKKWR